MSPSSAAAAAPSNEASGSALRTFIVEDSPVIRENLIATLEEMTPVQVVGSAEDEGDAKRWLDDPSHECELVIVDVVLRTGSGLGVLRAAAQPGSPRRFVVLTNYATSDIRERCRSLGADRVFDKSSELDDLIAFCVDMGDSLTRA
ncbi:MAG TPA: response regulator [Burkholderiaceae bacterium]|jgi:DNA-binding NarL/FixJ family response regulator|nr:response regulator [Burkholderiaceae bacterium]